MRRAPLVLALMLAACSGGSSNSTTPPPPACTPASAACSAPSECCTGSCPAGTCATSLTGGACGTTADCAPPLTCLDAILRGPGVPGERERVHVLEPVLRRQLPRGRHLRTEPRPVASAGPDAQAFRLTTVTLDGTGSFDPDGDGIYYSWTLQRPAGSWASIFSPDAARTLFQTDVEGTYVATLQVWDGLLYSSDSITITAPNRAPVVVAGADREVMRNTIVTVSSVGTYDPDNDTINTISFSLERPAGSAAVLEFNGWYEERTLRPDVVGVYTVTVTASDGKLTASDSVVLTAVNAAPEVTVTAVPVNAPERVDVTSWSQDRNNDTLTRAWRLVTPAASAATLSATTGTTTSYVPDVAGTYTVYFDVSDGFVTTTVSRETVVHPRVLKLAHDVVEAVCNDFCSTIYMASSSPANELWRFFVVPGTAETKLTALSGPALALGFHRGRPRGGDERQGRRVHRDDLYGVPAAAVDGLERHGPHVRRGRRRHRPGHHRRPQERDPNRPVRVRGPRRDRERR